MFSVPGVYTLIVTNIDNGCTAIASVEIFEDVATPLADAGQDGILTCDITEITLDGSSTQVVQIFLLNGSMIQTSLLVIKCFISG